MKTAEETLKELEVLCKALQIPLFAERETIGEALDYAYSLGDPAVTTAVHVVLNTVAAKLLGMIAHTESRHD